MRNLMRQRRNRVALITSPHAGRMNMAETPAGLLRRMGIEVTQELSVEEAARMAPSGWRWKLYGVTAVVAAGGDGTIGTAAAHVVGTNLPLGILPLGTSNDVARALGVPLNLEQAATAIAEGAVTETDAGIVVTREAQTEAVPAWRLDQHLVRLAKEIQARRLPRTFLHAATLGLNIEFARLATDASRRERLGQLTYAASTVEALTKLQPVPVTLRLRGVRMPSSGGEDAAPQHDLTITCNALQVAVVNTPVFGGGLNLRVPGVSANDQLLDFLVVEAPESGLLRGVAEAIISGFARLGETASGAYLGLEDEDVAEATAVSSAGMMAAGAGSVWPGVRRIQARAARIETPTVVDVTLDGEICARTPFEVSVARHPLRVLLPRDAHRAPAEVTATATHNSSIPV